MAGIQQTDATRFNEYRRALAEIRTATLKPEPEFVKMKEILEKYKVSGKLVNTLESMSVIKIVKHFNWEGNAGRRYFYQWISPKSEFDDKWIAKLTEKISKRVKDQKQNRSEDTSDKEIELELLDKAPNRKVLKEFRPAQEEPSVQPPVRQPLNVRPAPVKEVEPERTTYYPEPETGKRPYTKRTPYGKSGIKPRYKYVGTLFTPQQLEFMGEMLFPKETNIQIDNNIRYNQIGKLVFIVDGVTLRVKLLFHKEGHIDLEVGEFKVMNKTLAFSKRFEDSQEGNLVITTVDM